MIDTGNLTAWKSVLTLKKNDKILGLLNEKYLVIGFPIVVGYSKNFIEVSRPTWDGLNLGTSLFTYCIPDEMINDLFNMSKDTYADLKIKYEAEHWKERS